MLEADQDDLRVERRLEAGGHPLVVVQVPDGGTADVLAGWRGLTLSHSGNGPDRPPMLVPGVPTATSVDAAFRAALLPEDWNPPVVYSRGGETVEHGITLPPGGQVWIRLTDFFAEIQGTATANTANATPIDPVVRVVYYKGGRLDIQGQFPVRSQDPVSFKAWSPESDGWLGILTEPTLQVPSVTIKIDNARRP